MTDERNLSEPAPDAAWRKHSTEEPPAHLDAAILAAAHRAVNSAPQSPSRVAAANRPWRWWAPLAAAATIGAIAIGVLHLLPSDHESTPNVVSDTPSAPPAAPVAPAPRSAVLAAAPPAETRAKADAPQAPAPAQVARPPKTSMRAAEAPADKLSQQPAAAPEPFPARKDIMVEQQSAPPPPSPAASVVREIERAQIEGGAAAGRVNAQTSAGAAAPLLAKKAVRDEAKAERDPQDWIAQIRKFLAEGNAAEAARELAAFRAAFADADQRLPDDLRAWAATIKR